MDGYIFALYLLSCHVPFLQIPTFRANPLHPKCDEWCDFPVADRPNAVKQWIDAAAKDPSMIKGAWILLLECDYVWMRPVQAPDAYDAK
jgi:hypothetical protein